MVQEFIDEAWIRSSSSLASTSSSLHSSSSSDNQRYRFKKPTSGTQSNTTDESGRLLAESIKACSGWHLLRALLISIEKSDLNHLHISSALARTAQAARISPNMSQHELKDISSFFNNTLLPIATRLLPSMGPRELCNSLQSIATLLKPPSSLSHYSSTSLAKQMDAWLDACLSLVRSNSLRSPRDLSSVVWSLSILLPLIPDHQRNEGRAINIFKAILSSSIASLHFFNAQDLSTLLVGMERLSSASPRLINLHDKITKCLLDHSLYLMSNPGGGAHVASTSQSWSNILHSIDQLSIIPDLKWLRTFSKLNRSFLKHCSGQSLSILASALGRLWAQHSGPLESPMEVQEWSHCLLNEVISRLHSELGGAGRGRFVLSTEDVTNIALSLPAHAQILCSGRKAEQGLQLVAQSSKSLQDTALISIASLKPKDLAGTVVAMARLQRTLSLQGDGPNLEINSHLMKAWSKQALLTASSFNCPDVSQSLWALAILNPMGPCISNPLEWMKAFLTVTRPMLADMTSSQLSVTLWSISEFLVKARSNERLELDWQWKLSFFRASSQLLSSNRLLSIRDLAMMLHGMGRLRMKPIRGWSSILVSFFDELLASDQLQLSGRSLALALWGCHRSFILLPRKTIALILKAVLSCHHSMTQEESAIAAWSITSLWLRSESQGLRSSGRAKASPPPIVSHPGHSNVKVLSHAADTYSSLSTLPSPFAPTSSKNLNPLNQNTLILKPNVATIDKSAILVKPFPLKLLLLPPRPPPKLQLLYPQQAVQADPCLEEDKAIVNSMLKTFLQHSVIDRVLCKSEPLVPTSLVLVVKSLGMAGVAAPQPPDEWMISVLSSLAAYSDSVTDRALNHNQLTRADLSTFSSILSGLRSIQAFHFPSAILLLSDSRSIHSILKASSHLIGATQHQGEISTLLLGVRSIVTLSPLTSQRGEECGLQSLLDEIATVSIARSRRLEDIRSRVLEVHKKEMGRRSTQSDRDRAQTGKAGSRPSSSGGRQASRRPFVRLRLPSARLRSDLRAIGSFVDRTNAQLSGDDRAWLESRWQ